MSKDAKIHKVVNLIYESSLDPSLWKSAMREIGYLFNAPGSHLLLTNKETELPIFGLIDGFSDSANQLYIDHYAALDERWKRILALPHGDAKQIPELISKDEAKNSIAHNEFLIPYGGTNQLITRLDISDQQNIVLGVIRDPNGGIFERDEIAIFQQIMGHIQRAIQISVRLDNFHLMLSALRSRINDVPYGVIFLDKNRSVVFLNSVAESDLTENNIFLTGNDGFHVKNRKNDIRLQQKISSAIERTSNSSSSSGGYLSIRHPGSSYSHSVWIAPVQPNDAFFASIQPAVIVIISSPNQSQKISILDLVEQYQLTKREAEMASLLANGLDIDACANHMNITRETARSYLKRVFSKTNTGRQAELVLLLGRTPILNR